MPKLKDDEFPPSPEDLFRQLRLKDKSVRDLLLRQGDALREYSKLPADRSDVAIELQTGGGKTLVGLLIAEWRRRALGHRVAYVCPNVQLAHQVSEKAAGYGIDVVTLVRKQKAWKDEDFYAFQRAKSIAVTGYKQIFNSNPRLASAQTLVLDDAHAAENAVAENWSIECKRDTPLYTAVLEIVAGYLPSTVPRRLRDNSLDPAQQFETHLIPPEAIQAEIAALDTAITDYATEGSNFHAKSMIGSHLSVCLFYVSWQGILIRPYIPPTSEHPAFADAQQRVYMSATLGTSGELERSFGVSEIDRITVKSGEDAIGRRLFVLPNASPELPAAVATKAFEVAGRSVLLAPSKHQLMRAEAELLPDGIEIIPATSIEKDFSKFLKHDHAVLALANRYDGIDLPDNSCRLVALSGFPSQSHLQERFVMSTLGARRVLSERIRTRIQQGCGRATRNGGDFAVVLILGEQLTDFLAREDERADFPAQMQAELVFGFANSESGESTALELVTSFLRQDAEWANVDDELNRLASSIVVEPSKNSVALSKSAGLEVEYSRALWRGDFEAAVPLAQSVTDALVGDDELRPFRALWFYFASSWARVLASTDPNSWADLALGLQNDSNACARGTRWRPVFPNDAGQAEGTLDFDERSERASDFLRRKGVRGNRMDRYLTEMTESLATDDPKRFESGLQKLGVVLGFLSDNWSDSGAPDGLWRTDDSWIVFEVKSDEDPGNPLAMKAVRQVLTHEDWAAETLGIDRPSVCVSTVVTYERSIDVATKKIAKHATLTPIDDVRSLAAETAAHIRELHPRARAMSQNELSDAFSQMFKLRKLGTDELLARFSRYPIRDFE